MNKNQKIAGCSLLPDIALVRDVETVRIFSDFCEKTCSNLFAFSPYQLLIEREDFFYFQCMADELKTLLSDSGTAYNRLAPLCENLYSVYSTMMKNCWNAFVRSSYIENELGKFTLQQQMIVEKFDKEANLQKNNQQAII